MKIISDDCRKLIKFMREYDKWEFNSDHYYVQRKIGEVDIELWPVLIVINGEYEDWDKQFNFIESIYLGYERWKLRRFKIKEYNKTKDNFKNSPFTKIINEIDNSNDVS